MEWIEGRRRFNTYPVIKLALFGLECNNGVDL